MAEDKQKKLLNTLATEVMQALSEAGKKPGGFNLDNFSRALSERESVTDLLEKAGRDTGLEVAKSKKEVSIESLQARYKEVSEELRHSDSRLMEIEDSFKNLASALVSLAMDPEQPALEKELRLLRQSLRQKIVPSRLDASTKVLKDYVMRGGAPDPTPTPAQDESGPEGLEENVRDILITLVQDIAILEDEETQKRSKVIIRKITNEFTLEDFEPFIHDIHDLIFHIKELIRQEKKQLYGFSREIISKLEDAEKELISNIDVTVVRLGPVEAEFERQVAGDIREIELSFDEGLPIEQVRFRVMDKINSIRHRFKRKRAEDQARLEKLAEEKQGVERRLKEIQERHQEFARKSQKLVEEMERFRKESLHDALTGAFNRRAFDLHIHKALEEYRAGRLARFGLIIFDIDHFKKFNNSFGHRAGDKTLIYVSKFAKESMRADDMLFRYGGDEFAIILPEADLKIAAKVAGNIRTGINSVEFRIYKESSKTVRVGLSMGVAEGRKSDDLKTIFNRADKALYLAKEKGRNQVRTEKEVKNL